MTEQVGTNTSFDLPVDELIEIALEGIGGENTSGKEAKLSRTALNLVLSDLQNRAGIGPLSQVTTTSVTLVSGSANNYDLSSDILNIHHAVVRVSSSASGYADLTLNRVSYDEWLSIPTKETTKGRPTQFIVDRQRANLKVSFWPEPDSGKYSFYAWTTRRIPDVDASYQLVGVPRNYLHAVTLGLRHYMATLRGVPLEERQYLKMEYLEALQLALDFDRERVDFEIYPDLGRIL